MCLILRTYMEEEPCGKYERRTKEDIGYVTMTWEELWNRLKEKDIDEIIEIGDEK